MEPDNDELKIESKGLQQNPEEPALEGKEFLTHELHNKAKLSSLRSYQGDMAEFIKEKNESVLSIAAKEKKRKDERKLEEEKENKLIPPETKKKPASGDGFQVNLSILFSSLVLLAGGVAVTFYVVDYLRRVPREETVITNEILPFNNALNLANVSKDTLRTELGKVEVSNGISKIDLTDTNGKPISKMQDFFSFIQAGPPSTLSRTLKSDFALGATAINNKTALFLIISTNDFGLAFSSMLEWEKTTASDLPFFADWNEATSTNEFLYWKDIIVKNKDTRVLTNNKNNHKIGYTFLDENTILVVSDINIIGNISSAFASRSFTR